MPERIQLSRRMGWRLPPGAVSVARPTKWGNPFHVGAAITDNAMPGITIGGEPLIRSGVVEDRAHAVLLYRLHLLLRVPFTRAQMVAELAGKDLACWCPIPDPGQPDICHARVLLELCNNGKGPTDA